MFYSSCPRGGVVGTGLPSINQPQFQIRRQSNWIILVPEYYIHGNKRNYNLTSYNPAISLNSHRPVPILIRLLIKILLRCKATINQQVPRTWILVAHSSTICMGCHLQRITGPAQCFKFAINVLLTSAVKRFEFNERRQSIVNVIYSVAARICRVIKLTSWIKLVIPPLFLRYLLYFG